MFMLLTETARKAEGVFITECLEDQQSTLYHQLVFIYQIFDLIKSAANSILSFQLVDGATSFTTFYRTTVNGYTNDY